MVLRTELFRLGGTQELDPAVEQWLAQQAGELGDLARAWFSAMRACGDEVREVLHDGVPTACLGDAAFGNVAVYTAHVNVGFFQGSALRDPKRMLQGVGKFMRHVKLRPGAAVDGEALRQLIEAAYEDVKAWVEGDARRPLRALNPEVEKADSLRE